MTPLVTALRPRGAARTAVELDGRPWRVFHDACIVEAGLAVDHVLTRERVVALARARRRYRALAAAERALAHRDRSSVELDAVLARRGVRADERAQAVAHLRHAGAVDDRRFAHARAGALAGRGRGDLAIAHDLGSRGLERSLIDEVLGSLEPERDRVARLVAERGATPATMRFLARQGFSDAALERLVDELAQRSEA